jgi:hypothetical protein
VADQMNDRYHPQVLYIYFLYIEVNALILSQALKFTGEMNPSNKCAVHLIVHVELKTSAQSAHSR